MDSMVAPVGYPAGSFGLLDLRGIQYLGVCTVTSRGRRCRAWACYPFSPDPRQNSAWVAFWNVLRAGALSPTAFKNIERTLDSPLGSSLQAARTGAGTARRFQSILRLFSEPRQARYPSHPLAGAGLFMPGHPGSDDIGQPRPLEARARPKPRAVGSAAMATADLRAMPLDHLYSTCLTPVPSSRETWTFISTRPRGTDRMTARTRPRETATIPTWDGCTVNS